MLPDRALIKIQYFYATDNFCVPLLKAVASGTWMSMFQEGVEINRLQALELEQVAELLAGIHREGTKLR